VCWNKNLNFFPVTKLHNFSAEIHAAIYEEVQPFNIIGAVLQQELILYCGKLIATNPELFSGILKVRIGWEELLRGALKNTQNLLQIFRWILHALELYRGMTLDNPDPLETCSPSRIRKLLLEVLSKSRAIHFTMTKPISQDEMDSEKFTMNPIYHIGEVDVSRREIWRSRLTFPIFYFRFFKLTIFQVRQLSGCLIRVPPNFYEDLWYILKKAPKGVYIGDFHLPQEPTISKMSR